jgi:hypothetical protein
MVVTSFISCLSIFSQAPERFIEKPAWILVSSANLLRYLSLVLSWVHGEAGKSEWAFNSGRKCVTA